MGIRIGGHSFNHAFFRSKDLAAIAVGNNIVWRRDNIQSAVHDFLIRSDLPGTTYSGIGECIEAVMADYPEKLTRDVTITCTKKALEVRGSDYNSKFGIWSSNISNWNKDSLYTLTIDGKGLYTLDCKWLGGLLFDNVDNVYIKNISMLNYCNFYGQSTPEEIAAVMFRGNDDSKVKNVALYNCKFNGEYISSSGAKANTWYCLRFKKTANIVLDSCRLELAGGVAVFMSEIEAAEITRSFLQADYYINAGGLGHANVLSISGDNGFLKIADSVIDGIGMIEYACTISGINEFDLLRNTVKNCSGQAFSISKRVNKFNVISNLFYSNITNGQFAYTRRIFGASEIGELNVDNNTVYFNGEFSTSQEFFNGNLEKLVNCNNIYINHLNKAYAVFKSNTGIKEYIACNNIYASKFYNDDPTKRFANFKPVSVEMNDTEGYLDFSFDTRSLAEFASRGYEIDSAALSSDDKILNIDNDGSDYKLLSPLKDTYKSNKLYAARFDIDYLRANGDVSRGAYNLFGESWDETTDTSVGYNGTNTTDLASFDNHAVYTVPTDDIIILRITSDNRQIFIRSLFMSENGEAFLRFGQIITASLQCNYDKDTGMYIKDNNYTLNIREENYG